MVSLKDRKRADGVIAKLEGVVQRHPKTMLVTILVLFVANLIRF